MMEGYVINKTNMWVHAMKRAVGPGAKISLEELFEQYGVKHGLNGGSEFIEWLKNVKLKDKDKWSVVINTEGENVENIESEKTTTKSVVNKPAHDGVAPPVKSKTEVVDIVGLSVRQARETLPKIKDLTLLKYAFQEANQLAGKDSLCRLIRKRIKEIQIAR